jgi:hypothetical protein
MGVAFPGGGQVEADVDGGVLTRREFNTPEADQLWYRLW